MGGEIRGDEGWTRESEGDAELHLVMGVGGVCAGGRGGLHASS